MKSIEIQDAIKIDVDLKMFKKAFDKVEENEPIAKLAEQGSVSAQAKMEEFGEYAKLFITDETCVELLVFTKLLHASGLPEPVAYSVLMARAFHAGYTFAQTIAEVTELENTMLYKNPNLIDKIGR